MTPGKDRIIVIGAGMGGLASAIRLAHAGCEVTVVEASATPGGKMRTLPSAAGAVDAGPTVMTMRPVFEALFNDVGAELTDFVTLHAETTLARHWWSDGSSLDCLPMPRSPKMRCALLRTEGSQGICGVLRPGKSAV